MYFHLGAWNPMLISLVVFCPFDGQIVKACIIIKCFLGFGVGRDSFTPTSLVTCQRFLQRLCPYEFMKLLESFCIKWEISIKKYFYWFHMLITWYDSKKSFFFFPFKTKKSLFVVKILWWENKIRKLVC